ncbi:MAG: DUF6884 domain-containing protein [Actinomycetota bacterium]
MNLREVLRIGLVGCVKQKASRAMPAADLYESTLFEGRRAFVKLSCDRWWILSAEHGLVHPASVLEPYDRALKDMGRAERRAWSEHVLRSLDDAEGDLDGAVVEIHAGAEYRDFGVTDGLRRRGCQVEVPTEGMRIGRQLQFYAQARHHGDG